MPLPGSWNLTRWRYSPSTCPGQDYLGKLCFQVLLAVMVVVVVTVVSYEAPTYYVPGTDFLSPMTFYLS